MKRTIIITCLISLAAAIGAYAADETAATPPANGRPMRPLMDNILMPRMVDKLGLTADQKIKYDALNASFKKDVANLQAANSQGSGNTSTNKPPQDRQALRTLRKGYVDKVRAFLTADQNATLDKAMENSPMRAHRNAGSGGTNAPTPPPAPADK